MTTDLTKVTSALIKRGKHRGFLTMAEVQKELPDYVIYTPPGK